MSEQEQPNYDGKFDAIVVGAGPAGSTAALTMAREGLDVIMIERGQKPGSKNVFGGILFTPTLRELVDLDDAPLERFIAERRFSILSDEGDETAVSMRPRKWREEPHNDSFTVLRGKFDEWLAEQAVDAGVTLLTETTVTDLIKETNENGEEQIVGVTTDRPDGSLRAPIVVLSEGANSLVSEGAGLKEPDERANVAVSVKEVFKFDKETIKNRFRLNGDEEGVAYHYFGEGACGDSFGGGFIYTNRETLSVGVAYRIEDSTANNLRPEEVLNDFKTHPSVAPLVRGGRLLEYSAHAIPEGGLESVPDLVHNGAVIVGDAAGMVLNNGVHLEGTNMAVESGYHAGRAIAEALAEGRTDADALGRYRDYVEDSFVLRNLEYYRNFHHAAAEEKDFLFRQLPEALAEAETEYFRMDRESKKQHVKRARKPLVKAAGGYLGLAKTAWKFRRMFS